MGNADIGKNHEKEAFAALYDACADRLYRFLTLRLGSVDDAAEVIQQTFLRLAKSRRKLEQIADPVAYTFTVACHEATRWQQRYRKEKKRLKEWAHTVAARVEPVDLDQEVLVQGIMSLPRELRVVVELKLVGELTLAQVADSLGIPRGTAATRYRAALARLRALLTKEIS